MAIRKDIISSFQTREVGSERPHLPPVSQNRSAPRGAPHLTSEEGRKNRKFKSTQKTFTKVPWSRNSKKTVPHPKRAHSPVQESTEASWGVQDSTQFRFCSQ